MSMPSHLHPTYLYNKFTTIARVYTIGKTAGTSYISGTFCRTHSTPMAQHPAHCTLYSRNATDNGNGQREKEESVPCFDISPYP